MTFLYGVLGCLAVLLLLVAGGFAGWKLRGFYDGRLRRRELTDAEAKKIEQERRDLVAQQEAFHILQNYSAERAYGMTLEDDMKGGGAG